MTRIGVIDSHTAGEPTRVVISGGPALGPGDLAARREIFRREHDSFRAAVVDEPRGSAVLVGALLVPPLDPACVAGVLFFNNVGCLGMCGHGLIGVVTTLAHLGRLGPGEHRLETPVGEVKATLLPDGRVAVENVPAFRKRHDLTIEVPGHGPITGDLAWGGNWFFLVHDPGLPIGLAQLEPLTALATRLRSALHAQGFPEVDHIEFCGPSPAPDAHSRNFVLCPGGAYDRSPCGTGTSARLACLAAAGTLAEGAEWVQESVIGSRFTGTYRWADRAAGTIHPTITGRAYLTSEATLLLDPADPFCHGIGGP